MSQLFAWGSQSIEVSASASVLPMNKFLVCAKSLFKKHLSHLCWELLKQDSFKSSGESDPIRNAAGRACGFALNVRSRQGIPESEVRPRSTVDRDWPKAPSVGRDPGERAKKRRTDSLGNCHCPYFKIHFVDSMSSITSTAKLPQEIKSPTKGCFQPQRNHETSKSHPLQVRNRKSSVVFLENTPAFYSLHVFASNKENRWSVGN